MSDDHETGVMESFLAHVRNEDGRLVEHALEDHLSEVSRLAAEFAAEFQAAEWAALAGLWHDLGKYRSGFQRYIRRCGDPDAHIEGKVAGSDKTHSAAGALWAQQHLAGIEKRAGPVVARVMAYLIAGHHAGLDNWFGGLRERFAKDDTLRELVDTLAAGPPQDILYLRAPLPDIAAIPADHHAGIPGRFALWVRMLFSCLVDADFLDTEAFMSPTKARARAGFLSIEAMEAALQVSLAAMTRQVAARGEADSRVNGSGPRCCVPVWRRRTTAGEL